MSICGLIVLIVTMTTPAMSASTPARAEAPVAIARIDLASSSSSATVAQAPGTPSPVSPAPAPPAPAPGATTQPMPELSPGLAVAVGTILLAVALAAAALAGCFRGRSIVGPHRLEPGSRSVVPLTLIMLLGGGCWIGAQTAFFFFRAMQYAAQNDGAHLTLDKLGATDFALLATVPAAVALGVTLLADRFAALLRPIGLGAARLPKGVLLGLGFGVIALLVTQGGGMLLGAFYELIDYEHPQEHELLGAMKTAPDAVRILLVIGACVMAPLFEEVLFRGHMQTLLTRLFAPPAALMPSLRAAPLAIVRDPRAPLVGQPLPLPPLPQQHATLPLPPSPGQSLGYAVPETSAIPLSDPASYGVSPRREVTMRWLAVALTSIVFALVHPLWMAPLIFLLSLCLGYAYERTGSLWVPIFMHALFNTSSTVMFLNFM